MTWHGIIGVVTFSALSLVTYMVVIVVHDTGTVTTQGTKLVHPVRCLAEGERAEYEIENKQQFGMESVVHILVVNEHTNEAVATVTAPILQPRHYYPVEIRRCGVYFLQGINHNPSVLEQGNGFRSELWSFDYNGRGKKILLQSEVDSESQFRSYYSRDFRVSHNERWISLIKSYLSDSAYALVIRDIEHGEHVFTLSLVDIMSAYPDVAGSFGFLEWINNDRYFWSNIYDGAYTQGWVRVDTTDWSYEVFEAPEGILNGYPLNLETGWVPLIPDSFWTGVYELNEAIHEERRQAGETADLYLYNIFTQERMLIDDTDSPTWNPPLFRMEWLDARTLQYTHPSGELKVYRLEE